jgi:DNA-binding transcriptional regulator GbsR (MarR family)
MNKITASSVTPSSVERFILQWGDLGGQWGVNRSVAQIHAVLFLAEKPMTAEDLADQLSLARSNVSNSLKELLAWKLIRRVPLPADRRDHYEAETDIWEVVTRIAQGRKEREIDPAADALRKCLADARKDENVSPIALRRLTDMLDFIETMNGWYGQMINVPKDKLVMLIKMGAKVVSLLSFGRKAKAGGE